MAGGEGGGGWGPPPADTTPAASGRDSSEPSTKTLPDRRVDTDCATEAGTSYQRGANTLVVYEPCDVSVAERVGVVCRGSVETAGGRRAGAYELDAFCVDRGWKHSALGS